MQELLVRKRVANLILKNEDPHIIANKINREKSKVLASLISS